MLIRRFFAFVVSLFILFSLPLNAANAASNWNIDSAKSSGSRVILGASNNGYKSAINIPPNVAKIAKYGLRGANIASWAIAAASLVNDGIDFVLDPANNRVKYRINVSDDYMPNCPATMPNQPNFKFTHASKAREDKFMVYRCGYRNDNGFTDGFVIRRIGLVDNNYISLDAVAPKIVDQAHNGNTQAQRLLRDVATAAVIAGDYDADLLAGAVPINDTKPLIPAVPGAQVGDVDTGMTGGDVGAAADDARAAADAARAAADAARDAYDNAVKDAAKAAADAKDLINTAIDQAIKDAAAVAAAEAAKAAADAKSVADAAAVAAADAAKVAADKAVAAAEKSAADARAAADATVESIAAADKAVADAKAAAKEAAEAAKEAAKAVEKPFELPAFCSWATPVCDFIEWFKEPPPADLPAGDVPFATTGDIGLDDVDRFQKRIEFSGQCPVNDFSFTMMGVTYAKPIPYYHFCGFLEQIAPWLLAMCYLGTAYFVVENI